MKSLERREANVGVGRAGRRCRARAFAARERAPAAMGQRPWHQPLGSSAHLCRHGEDGLRGSGVRGLLGESARPFPAADRVAAQSPLMIRRRVRWGLCLSASTRPSREDAGPELFQTGSDQSEASGIRRTRIHSRRGCEERSKVVHFVYLLERGDSPPREEAGWIGGSSWT